MKNYKICLTVFLFGYSMVSMGGCLEDSAWVIRNGPGDETAKRSKTVCKIWPGTGFTIFVSAIEVAHRIDMEIMVVDPVLKKIVGSKLELDMLTDHAIYNTGISIDTAKYQLNDTLSAFGVRTSWQGSSAPNPYTSEILSLYTLQNGALKTLLNGMTVNEYHGEWDTRCKGEYSSRNMTLVVLPTSSMFNDIQVNENIKKVKSEMVERGCQNVILNTHIKRHIISHHVGGYVIPARLSSFVQ